jgi:hypothetical protein
MTYSMENLAKAAICLELARDDLREALKHSGAVAVIQIMEMIRQAAELAQRCDALRQAIEVDSQQIRE